VRWNWLEKEGGGLNTRGKELGSLQVARCELKATPWPRSENGTRHQTGKLNMREPKGGVNHGTKERELRRRTYCPLDAQIQSAPHRRAGEEISGPVGGERATEDVEKKLARRTLLEEGILRHFLKQVTLASGMRQKKVPTRQNCLGRETRGRYEGVKHSGLARGGGSASGVRLPGVRQRAGLRGLRNAWTIGVLYL